MKKAELVSAWVLLFLLCACTAKTVQVVPSTIPTATPTMLLASVPCRESPSRAYELVNRLSDDDWGKGVYQAAFDLEALEGNAITALMILFEQDKYIKLENTADLIYPGAETFYGHGWIIDYDLDWLPTRAGWVLENITFEDFRFSESNIEESTLLQASIEGKKDVPLTKVVPINQDSEAKKQQRLNATAEARAWWQENCRQWNRLDALIAALRSEYPHRVMLAINWLRFEETPITGLSKQVYIDEIFPIIQMLAESSDPDIVEQAKYLVDDYNANEWYWYEIKGTKE